METAIDWRDKEFQPFLRFYYATPHPYDVIVYTEFQPFLRFYFRPDMWWEHNICVYCVSTLLEILPLMLGGFLGF